jgi:polyhydroxyalkanoate synthesis regulator phasin
MSQFRAVASLLAAVLLLAAAGCGDDESASDRVCDARSVLRDDVQAVVDDVADGNLGDARDGLDEVQSASDDLASAVSDLGEEQRAALEPEVDQLESQVAELNNAESLEELGTGVDSVVANAESIVQDVGETLDCG